MVHGLKYLPIILNVTKGIKNKNYVQCTKCTRIYELNIKSKIYVQYTEYTNIYEFNIKIKKTM